MGILSTGGKWKNLANQAMLEAQTLEEEQKNIDFRRNLLANIRQQRIAAAQLEVYNRSDDYLSSSAEGAMANINSPLAGEIGYAYETTARSQKIYDYTQLANTYFEKYQKNMKKNAAVGKVLGAVGTVAGSIFGPVGAVVGGAIGTAAGSALGGGRVATMSAAQSAVKTGVGMYAGQALAGTVGSTSTAADTGAGFGPWQLGSESAAKSFATDYRLSQALYGI